MDYFRRVDGELWCEEVSLARLAERFDTPLYVYSERTIREHFLKLSEAFADTPHLICYAMKANESLAILRLLGGLGAGADIVSGGELHRALRAGIPPERIVYSGVGKTETELLQAIDAGIRCVNVENADEIVLLSELACTRGRRQPCALRVNPDVEIEGHDYLSTGRDQDKFGIPLDEAPAAAALAGRLPGLELTGLAFHLGSQILRPDPYRESLRQAKRLLSDLGPLAGSIRQIDIGGGLGAIYQSETPMSAEAFHDAILDLVHDIDRTLILEPGRFIVGNAGALLGRVQFVKSTPRRRFVILDVGMNDLIRPSLYGAYHRIEPVHAAGEDRVPAEIVGPICESADFLGRDRMLPHLSRGDLVAVLTAGAYGSSMASNYNQRPRAAEVLVSGGDARLIRRRETYEDLERFEEG